jgi:hypothetical protein
MRLADEGDMWAIIRSLEWMILNSPGHQMKFASIAFAEKSVRTAMAAGCAFYEQGYFIMVDVGNDWYSPHPFLIEQIILKLHHTDAPVSVAIAVLDDLKSQFNCKAIISGDTQVGLMTPHYLAAGYKQLGVQLLKE